MFHKVGTANCAVVVVFVFVVVVGVCTFLIKVTSAIIVLGRNYPLTVQVLVAPFIKCSPLKLSPFITHFSTESTPALFYS